MYAKFINCPECNKNINANANKCGCGWKKTENLEDRDQRCIFILNGERCNLLGTNYKYPGSKDGRCVYHHRTSENFEEASRWHIFIKNNFSEILHFRNHYQTNFKNCERCQKLCDAENEFSKNENKARGYIIF